MYAIAAQVKKGTPKTLHFDKRLTAAQRRRAFRIEKREEQ